MLEPRRTRLPPDQTSSGEAYAIPKSEPHRRILRLRRFAWFLDRSIPVGGNYRIGIDPLLGLIPGAGDWIGALLSIYFLYEATRLGISFPVLTRMAGNIVIESFIGTVPFLGDFFDFVWQANVRNVRLIEENYRPDLTPRSLRRVWLALAAFALVLLGSLGVVFYAAIKLLSALFS